MPHGMLRAGLLLSIVLVLPARAAPKPWTVAFVGLLSGPLAERTEQYLAGVRAAIDEFGGTPYFEDRPVVVVPIDDKDDPKAYDKVRAAVKKAKPVAILGAPSGRCTDALVKMARKGKAPLLLLTPWEPAYILDAKDTLIHLAPGHVDHAIWAAQYALLPFKAAKAAALTDGSEGSREFAAAFLRNLGMRIHDGGAHEVPADAEACAAMLRKLKEDGVDLAFVAGDAGAAQRAAAVRGEVPALLFMDGLVTPGLTAAAPETARWLEATIPMVERDMLSRYRKQREKAGEPPNPLSERGHAAVRLLAEGLRGNEFKEKGLVQAVRSFPDRVWRDTPLCTEWGAQKMHEFFLYGVNEGKPGRMEPLYLWSHTGGTLLRYRAPETYTADPEGIAGVRHGGDKSTATIDDDLKRLGLHSGGYEGAMDEWVKEELLARCLAYLNKMYWRNADGTPIPGVSFDITFCLKPPEGLKQHKVWIVTIAGDDPEAGGRAFPPNRAFTFSTFLERTMYRQHAMDPKLATPDVKYFIGRYEWGSSKEGNIRHDAIRSLVNGFAGAMALTTAHECGHLGGLGHDTVTKRSIMNVVDAKGLDPESGEWIPEHIAQLERSIGREPAPKK